jgi:hypothetical protein
VSVGTSTQSGGDVKFLSTNEGAAILSGAALAAVLGIMLGGSMRPQLIFDGRPMGPQMFANGGGPRSTGPFDLRDAYATYGGKLPTYVTGTDYAQTAYIEEAPVAEEPRQVAHTTAENPAPMTLARAAYDEPPAPIIVYPSMTGGSQYDNQTQPPPASSEDEAPTITG